MPKRHSLSPAKMETIARKLIRTKLIEKAAEGVKRKLLTQLEADERICQIINGTFEYTKFVFNPSTKTMEPKQVKPDAMETLQAYIAYCKRFGSFAPAKIDVNNKRSNTLKVEVVESKTKPVPIIDITPIQEPEKQPENPSDK